MIECARLVVPGVPIRRGRAMTTAHDPHTGQSLGRKLTPRERALMANLYVKLARREKRLIRAAARYGEVIEFA